MQIMLKTTNLLKIIVTVGLLTFFSLLFAQTTSETLEYKVQENDTLIKILKKHRIKPIYGNSGALATALKLNPKKQVHQGNLIFVGEILLIPKNLIGLESIKSHSVLENQIETKKKDNEKTQTIKQASHPTKVIKDKEEKPKPSKSKEEPPFKSINPFELEKPQKSEQTQIFQPSKEHQPPKKESLVPEFNKTPQPSNIESTSPATNNHLNNTMHNAPSIFEFENHFLPDYGNYCKPDPICTIWLWDLNNRCCNLQNSPLLIPIDKGM